MYKFIYACFRTPLNWWPIGQIFITLTMLDGFKAEISEYECLTRH